MDYKGKLIECINPIESMQIMFAYLAKLRESSEIAMFPILVECFKLLIHTINGYIQTMKLLTKTVLKSLA